MFLYGLDNPMPRAAELTLLNCGARGNDEVLARNREEAVVAVAWRLEGRSPD